MKLHLEYCVQFGASQEIHQQNRKSRGLLRYSGGWHIHDERLKEPGLFSPEKSRLKEKREGTNCSLEVPKWRLERMEPDCIIIEAHSKRNKRQLPEATGGKISYMRVIGYHEEIVASPPLENFKTQWTRL